MSKKKQGSVFCERCDRCYFPSDSTAENPQIYCSQACEFADDQIEDSDEEL